MGALGERDLDTVGFNLYFGGGVQKVTKELAGLGGLVSWQKSPQHPIQSSGGFGQGDIKVHLETDRGTERVQVKKVDRVGQRVFDQHALGHSG